MKMRLMLVVCAALALTVGVTTASAGGGNSGAAQACQKGGWQNLVRSDGTSFGNQGDCVSYAAQGGTLTKVTKSQLDCEAAGGVFSTTVDINPFPVGNPPFLWSCASYSQTNVIAVDCFDDGGIPSTFFDRNGVLIGTTCYAS